MGNAGIAIAAAVVVMVMVVIPTALDRRNRTKHRQALQDAIDALVPCECCGSYYYHLLVIAPNNWNPIATPTMSQCAGCGAVIRKHSGTGEWRVVPNTELKVAPHDTRS